MTAHETDLTALIGEIRTAFNRLKAMAETLHADLDINSSMRAVLEALIHSAPQTVPEIAKGKGVSRQHVQKNMNALLEKGLVQVHDNPDHKRSVLYHPSPAGAALFTQMRARESAPLAALTKALAGQDVAAAVHLLAQLNTALAAVAVDGNDMTQAARGHGRTRGVRDLAE